MRNTLRIIGITIATLLAATGLAVTPAVAASTLSISAPTQVDAGWNGTISVSGYNEGGDQYLNLQVSGPDGYNNYYRYVYNQESFTKSFTPGPFTEAGDYQVYAYLDDSSAADSTTITVNSVPPTFKRAEISDDLIYPRVRDRYKDNIEVKAATKQKSTIETVVRNRDGRIVRRGPSKTYRPSNYGPYQWSWNGENNNGDVVPLGRYTIEITATNDERSSVTKRFRGIEVATDVITKHRYVSHNGNQTSSRTRHGGDCYFYGDSYNGRLSINCLDYNGGSYARATYGFKIPASARNIKWGVAGRVECCSPGSIDRSGNRTSGTRFVTSVRVTRYRAFNVNYSWIKYTYDRVR